LFNRVYHIFSRNHVHALRHYRTRPRLYRQKTQTSILRRIVAQCHRTAAPAAAVIAAWQTTVSVKILVMRIGFPLNGFSPSGQHNTCAIFGPAGRRFYSRGKVHKHSNGADYSISVIHEPNHLSQVGLPDKIDYTFKRRVAVTGAAAAALYK
jgi:hypothetical protein